MKHSMLDRWNTSLWDEAKRNVINDEVDWLHMPIDTAWTVALLEDAERENERRYSKYLQSGGRQCFKDFMRWRDWADALVKDLGWRPDIANEAQRFVRAYADIADQIEERRVAKKQFLRSLETRDAAHQLGLDSHQFLAAARRHGLNPISKDGPAASLWHAEIVVLMKQALEKEKRRSELLTTEVAGRRIGLTSRQFLLAARYLGLKAEAQDECGCIKGNLWGPEAVYAVRYVIKKAIIELNSHLNSLNVLGQWDDRKRQFVLTDWTHDRSNEGNV